MNITELMIKDVRCFKGAQKFAIRPITFLVGENSTGKSTALGCLQILNNAIHQGEKGLNFNTEPYFMGTFSDIVRRSRPSIRELQIGIGIKDGSKGTTKYCLTLAKKDKGSEPVIQQHQILFQNGSKIIIKQKNKYQPERRDNKIREPLQQGMFFSLAEAEQRDNKIKGRLQEQGKRPIVFESAGSVHYPLLDLLNSVKHEIKSSYPKAKNIGNKLESSIENIGHVNIINSFAPIRSKPKRTYDPFKEEWDPEGDEIPMVLNNISRSKRQKEAWHRLEKELSKFGKSSGLYKEISVKKLGESTASPFQLQIKVRGPRVNLIDVGYGVSQILPVLVRIFLMRSTTFLMQQPEVHLHPQAQAEFSSLMIDTYKTMQHNFIIETHSDYIVDRARIEIMKGNIKPEDVSLVFLEPVGNHVKVHNIRFDEQTNMLGVPQSYGKFFIKETNELLGFIE